MGPSSISQPLSYTRLNLIRQVLVGTRKSTKENAIYSAEEDRRGELDIPNKDGSKGKIDVHWFNLCPAERFQSSITPCIMP
jgi:hypothetical protein